MLVSHTVNCGNPGNRSSEDKRNSRSLGMHLILFSLFFWILLYPGLSNLEVSTPTQQSRAVFHTNTTSSFVSSLMPLSNCNFKEENGLAVYCTQVDIEELAPNIPNDTVRLEITKSPLRALTKPLFSHLHDLRYLKLSHNGHKFITRNVFQGLHNLEELDLSFNNIAAFVDIFVHTPNLKILNLDSNEFFTVRTIANAISHLENFENLTLNYNTNIRRILSKDFAAFSTNITKLQLFNTSLEIVEEGAFRPLRHLKVLELSMNYLDEIAFRNVTADLREIKVLLIRYAQFQKGLPYEALSLLGNTPIQQLDISHNYFVVLDKFPPIRTLTKLAIAFCSIESLTPEVFAGVPNLEGLALHGNHLLSLPQHVFGLPKLKALTLGNQKPGGTSFPLRFPNYLFTNATDLRAVDLSRTPTNGIIPRYAFHGLWKLQGVVLSSCSITRIEDYAFETLVSLVVINLKDNKLDFLTNHTFAGLHSLEAIALSQNKIKFVQGVYPFHNSPLLFGIYMNRNQIVEIPNGMFSGNVLLKELALSQNKIVSWDFTVLAPESNVSVLFLSKNKIAHITPSMMTDFLRVSDVLDVSENPFNCTECGMKDFQRFINETETSFLFDRDSKNVTSAYTCSSPANLQRMPLLSVDIPQWHCFPQEVNTAGFIMTLVLSAMVPLFLVTIFCYALRWYIRYWLFQMKTTLKKRTQIEGECLRHYMYDVFVCYNASDTPWVLSTLIPSLEKQELRYRLCTHDRDFDVRRLITDNIQDGIEASRKVILVLSESFLASEWLLFESQHRLIDETRDVLVLIKLKDINRKLYTKNLRYLEKTRPCLSWTVNSVGQQLFWNKMKRILGEPSTDCQEEMTHC